MSVSDLAPAAQGPTPEYGAELRSAEGRQWIEYSAFGISYLIAAAVCALVLPPGHPISLLAPAAAILLVVSSRFYVQLSWGWIGCQQAAFVLLAFTLPLNFVPMAAFFCLLVGERDAKPTTHYVLSSAANSWYALIASVLLAALAPGAANWHQWPAYAAAFGGEALISPLISAARGAVRKAPLVLTEELTVIAVDVSLALIGLAAAVELHSAPGGALALMAGTTGLLALLNHEHGQRRVQTERALKDPLTGLANRTLFSESGAACEARCRRSDQHAALLLIDLDDFKLINDTYGHQAGDEALLAFANGLRQATRAIDVPARLGGDEFAVIVAEPIAPGAARHAAETLRQRLARPARLSNGETVPIRFSIGFALFGSQSSLEDAILQADAALYADKRSRKTSPSRAGLVSS